MRSGSGREDGWKSVGWREYRDETLRVARGLIDLGATPGQGVAILGSNRPEWFLADLGAIAAGALPAGIYATSTPEQCRYVAAHAAAQVVVVEDEAQLEKLLEVRDRLPELRAIVLVEGESGEAGVVPWGELLERGERTADRELRERLHAQRPEDPCTLIYTSGTTGVPKAVMLSHRNITWTAEALASCYSFEIGESLLSYLPLSHVAEQMVTLHAPMTRGACTWFAASLDTLPDDLRAARPHIFFGVPRVWEKIGAGIETAAAAAPAWRRRLLDWARGVGLAAARAGERGERRPLLYPVADRLVFRKVRRRLGFDRARILATGAAPTALSTLELFFSLGMPLYEVYGMSEVTGPGTFSTPDRYRIGSAGAAVPGAEVAVAPDGEILMRGPHVFLGYLGDEEATREILSEDGWVRSGDVGRLDPEGFLWVTDRKKELLVTAGGKNVAPQPLEAELKRIPGVAQAVAVGDRRPFVAALLVLDPARLPPEASAGGPPQSTAEAAADATVRAWLEARIEEVNAGLARYERIRRFAVLPRELSLETGELTPTLKLRRRVIGERWAEQIEAMYG